MACVEVLSICTVFVFTSFGSFGDLLQARRMDIRRPSCFFRTVANQMSVSRSNLKLSMPRCGYCNARWRPPEGVNASETFCPHCADERLASARERFQLDSLNTADLVSGYLLPRRYRVIV